MEIEILETEVFGEKTDFIAYVDFSQNEVKRQLKYLFVYNNRSSLYWEGFLFYLALFDTQTHVLS